MVESAIRTRASTAVYQSVSRTRTESSMVLPDWRCGLGAMARRNAIVPCVCGVRIGQRAKEVPGAAAGTSLALWPIRTPQTQGTIAFRRAIAPRPHLQSGRTMLDSVRVRLTLWYTAVLALVLIALSTITYFIFWRSTVQRTDVNLAELSEAFLTTLDAEVSDQSGPDSLRLAGQVAITEHRFRDHVFAIFDSVGNIVVSSQELPPAAVGS